ncbi:MAG: DUF4270 family protein [Bacteroidia bacterium]
MLKKSYLLIALALLALSCKKNMDSPVGINVLPPSDLINAEYAEIYPDVSYTKYRWSDSIILTSNLSNSNLLGSINDPVFGRTDVSIYCSFETVFSASGVGGLAPVGSESVLDSVVLVLAYNYVPNTSSTYIGDTTDELSLDVFPLKSNLSPDTNYYSTGNNFYYTGSGSYLHGPIPYDASNNLIYGGHSLVFTPHLWLFPPIKKDTNIYTNPMLRVRLRQDWGEQLFNTTTNGYLNNNALFQQFLKGLYITTQHSIMLQPNYGSIFFVLMDNNSGINFYYHNQGSSIIPPPIIVHGGSTCNRFSYFKHDYSIASADLQHQISKTYADTNPLVTPLPTNKNVFLQGGAGVGIVLKFPSLLQWADKNIVINKAELVLKPDMSNTNFFNLSQYFLPGRLYLEADTLGGPRGLLEDLYTFGGYYDIANNQYLFELPNSIDQILTRRTLNTKFYVTVYNGGIFAERVVFGGTAQSHTSGYPIKLRLWYTLMSAQRVKNKTEVKTKTKP